MDHALFRGDANPAQYIRAQRCVRTWDWVRRGDRPGRNTRLWILDRAWGVRRRAGLKWWRPKHRQIDSGRAMVHGWYPDKHITHEEVRTACLLIAFLGF
jgi:hypothetical protein